MIAASCPVWTWPQRTFSVAGGFSLLWGMDFPDSSYFAVQLAKSQSASSDHFYPLEWKHAGSFSILPLLLLCTEVLNVKLNIFKLTFLEPPSLKAARNFSPICSEIHDQGKCTVIISRKMRTWHSVKLFSSSVMALSAVHHMIGRGRGWGPKIDSTINAFISDILLHVQ